MPENSPDKKIIEIGHVRPREITAEMTESYIDYAMSVIISRALPDVRDGLKPVQRRILYAMHEMGLGQMAKYRKSATVVGECFVKDTMVLTKKGLVPIQEIKVGDWVYTQSGLRKVIQLYEMPEKPLLKVTLGNGISNIVTPSQKFKVLTPDWKFEWKEAKDLTKNDYLVIKADYPEIKNLVKLNQIEENQPRYLNENIAYLLGLFTSDGWVTEDYCKKKYPRIGFSFGPNLEVANKIVSIFEQEFNYTPTIEIKHYRLHNKKGEISNKKQYVIRVNRKFINEFFVSNFNLEKIKAITKKIPLQIFRSSTNVIFSFISGLIDGDGCISTKTNLIRYLSVSEKLIDQLLILLLQQNIFSSKLKYVKAKSHYINKRRVKGRFQPYCLEIRGKNAIQLAKSINLNNNLKKICARNITEGKVIKKDVGFQYDIIPYAGKIIFEELSSNHLGAGWYQDTNGNKFRMGIKYPNGGCKIRYSSDLWEKPLRKTQVINWRVKEKLDKIGSPLFEFLEHIIKNKIYFLKVSSIKKVSPEKTYDFEVEDDHEFIANGTIAHNCMGKYHPHGDAAIYDALVRMAQDFSLRYPLIEGQGNFASIDDPTEAAAMRYTECRLSKIGEEMLKDIEKETVNFVDNYDATRKEPVVLPSPLPQLLVNGTLGIAVGMATNIPPHNLSEVCQALTYLLDRPGAETPEILEFIKGPDFPTGGIVYGGKEITTTYSQGKGGILVRGKAEVIEDKQGKKQIIISEIPFQVSKSRLLEQFAKLVEQKRIRDIKDIRDESDKEGMRIVIDLSRSAFPKKILNRLYKLTELQKTFHLNMIALVDGIQPCLLNLVDVLSYFLKHKKEVVIKRTGFDLQRAKERAHILAGLHKCLTKIDAVIKTIKASENREAAKINLMEEFGLTEIQATAILETRLQQLARLERGKIETELKEKKKLIQRLEAILKSPEEIKKLIKEELKEIQEKYGDVRKTKIIRGKVSEISEEDLVPLEETVIILTQKGFIKREKPSSYKSQKRGGKGVLGAKIGEEDIISHFVLAQTHDLLLFFTDIGRVFQLPAYEIPEGTRLSRGKHIANFIEVAPEEKILNILPQQKKQEKTKYLLMATKKGLIKKTAIEEFENVRKSGLIAIRLKKDDSLVDARKTSGKDLIILASQKGKAIIFKEKDLRPMGRTTAGNIGIKIRKDDKVIGVEVIPDTKETKLHLLTVTENGFGKRSPISQYRIQRRGGAGLKTAKLNNKTGHLAAVQILTNEQEYLIIISQKSQVIKTRLNTVRLASRATQGVKLINLRNGDKVASVICV